jgi:hypothetical protein
MSYDPEKKRAYYLANRERIRLAQKVYRDNDEYRYVRRLKGNK